MSQWLYIQDEQQHNVAIVIRKFWIFLNGLLTAGKMG